MDTKIFEIRKIKRLPTTILSIIVILALAFPAMGTASAFLLECSDPLGCVTIGPDDPVHIAYALTLSGPNESLGIDSRNGIEIAIDDSGGKILGHDVLLTGADEACSPEGGAAAGANLAADPTIVAVIGTNCSSAAHEAMPLLSSAGYVMVSPSNTRPDLTEPGDPNNFPGYLRVSWSDKVQGAVVARFARDFLGISTAATLIDGNMYSMYLQQAFADEFTNLGGTITSQETIEPGQTDMSTELANIAAGAPEMLYFPVFFPEGGYIINQARETAGLENAILMGSDALWTEEVVNFTGGNIEGVLVTNWDSTRNSSDYFNNFLPAYEARFGPPVSAFHAHSYDAFMMIKAAIENVAVGEEDGSIQIGRQALRDALYGTVNFPGLTGNLTCSETGDCADPHIAVYKYHPDQFPPVIFWPTTTYVVNTTDDYDNGVCNVAHCSLREAINASNANPASNTIVFDIPGSPPFTIQPGSALPDIYNPVTIDGTTQPGFGGTPVIELDGTNAGEGANGLSISAGFSTVQGLVVNRFSGPGISLVGGDENTIQGNFIGTDWSGTYALGNGDGIWLGEGTSNNVIGGVVPEARNLISGNNIFAVSINHENTRSNLVLGNYIGTDVNGTSAIPNAYGGVILTLGTSYNRIGGTEPGAGNLVSGNNGDGITIVDGGTSDNIVQGNFIGTDATGSVALGNSGRGTFVAGGAADNLIGGTEAGAANLVSGNWAAGIRITDVGTTDNKIQGNFIGTDGGGTIPVGNGFVGVRVSDGATNNLIGGTEAGARNLISGNRNSGVLVDGYATSGNAVQGNYIGTDVTGTSTTGPAGLHPGNFTLTLETACPAYPAGTNFDGFISEAIEPLAPWEGNSVTFQGTDACDSPETFGEASLIYRYRVEFDEDTTLTSVAVSGAAFNGPDNILRVLDESMNVLGTAYTFGGNSLQTPYITLQGAVGKVFFVDEFDTSSTWRYRHSIVINGSLPLGNLGSGVQISSGAMNNLVGGTEPGAGNLISGNGSEGVGIVDAGTTGIAVQGNLIGTDVNGLIALPNSLRGVFIAGGSAENLIGGTESGAGNLVSGNGMSGVNITDAHQNLVQGNLIGTNIDGTAAITNINGNGVVIDGGATGNVVGGAELGAMNLISGNSANGVGIFGPGTTGNQVEGNYIGTDLTGTQALGNYAPGVGIGDQAYENLITGNLISGNRSDGVALFNAGTSGNLLQGNLIGTDATGSATLQNAGVGVWVGEGASNTLIGGVAEGQGNIISGNNGDGISINHVGTTGNVIQGNYIGLNAAGNAPLPNNSNGVILTSGSSETLIVGNIISGNRAEGVAIFDPETTNNTVRGNYIGTDVNAAAITGSAGPDPGDFTVTVMEDVTCPTYDAGTDFDSFRSEEGEPLAPWSGSSVHFVGTEACTDREMIGAASLIYRYRIEFTTVTQLTSIMVSGAAFNGPDSVLRVLDENMEVLGFANTFGGNSFQTPYITLQGVEGTVFYIDEFDTSTTWRFRQSIVVNGPLPLGNSSNGVLIANGAFGNLIDGNVISGNSQNGVGIFNPGTTGNTVLNNYLGTDLTGMYALGNAAPGVSLGDQAFDNRIEGNLISGNRSDGVAIFNAGTAGNILQGNLIGTDATGNAALPNTGVGVWIGDGASNTLIGGVGEGEGNLISGNDVHGVSINSLNTTGTRVLGNYIGTNQSGDLALPNGAGGVFVSASQTWIGGTEPGAGNLISGNSGFGVDFQEEAAENFVQGNFIGTDASGEMPLGNLYSGINLGGGATGNIIGGAEPGAGNTIAFNAGRGIRAIFEAGTGNAILSNSVFSNGLLGIDLSADGVTLNDVIDLDAGPNSLQNFPIIISVTRKDATTMISGLLVSTPRTKFRLEFFSNDTCDPTGYGEGKTFLGFVVVTTNPVGIANFKITLPAALPKGAFVTATATDPGGNTSEFSRCAGPVK